MSLVLLLFSSLVVSFWYNNNYKGNYSFYNIDYTDSIIKGKLDLDIYVSDEIRNASNPYDPSDRKDGFQLDLSYYKGKYYSYFGILPNIELLVPYLVIGLITMYMNYIRFDNIFEFGVKYQLSDNNMHSNSFSIIYGLLGGFYYLFGTYNIHVLPFTINDFGNYFPILDDFHFESIGGGIITTSFISIVVLFIPFIIKKIKEKELKIYLILTTIIAFLLVFITSGIGALVGRYMLDFNYLFLFTSVFICLYFINKDKSNMLNKIYLVTISISIFINLFISYSNL